MKLACGINAGM